MKLTIEISDLIEWTSGDVTTSLDLTRVDAKKVAELVAIAAEAGFQKAGVDSAASAKKYAEDNKVTDSEAREILMGKRVKTWLSGEWGAVRGAGSGLSELDREMVSCVRENVKMRDKQAYKNMAESDRVAACVAYIEELSDKQTEALRKHAAARIEMRRKEREALKSLDLEV